MRRHESRLSACAWPRTPFPSCSSASASQDALSLGMMSRLSQCPIQTAALSVVPARRLIAGPEIGS